MTLKALSETQADVVVGQQWLIRVEASELPVLALTLPDGSTQAPPIEFEQDSDLTSWAYGYVATVTPAVAGRYIAAVTAIGTGEALIFQAWAAAVTANTDWPDVAALDDYLGGAGAHSWTDEQLQGALSTETAAQRRVCRIPAAYPDDLREALLRRSARNLEMRRQLTENSANDSADFPVPPSVPPYRDPEVRRLEAPWRKVPIG